MTCMSNILSCLFDVYVLTPTSASFSTSMVMLGSLQRALGIPKLYVEWLKLSSVPSSFFSLRVSQKVISYNTLTLNNIYIFGFGVCFFFLAAPCSLRDLSSPTRIEPGPVAVKVPSPNHWTAREVPLNNIYILMFPHCYLQSRTYSSLIIWLGFPCLCLDIISKMICFKMYLVSLTFWTWFPSHSEVRRYSSSC